jgi:hypothetical protein
MQTRSSFLFEYLLLLDDPDEDEISELVRDGVLSVGSSQFPDSVSLNLSSLRFYFERRKVNHPLHIIIIKLACSWDLV